jgi:C7-cyclitol 7-kinase
MEPVIAVDLGGTFIRCGVIDKSGNKICFQKKRINNFLSGNSKDVIWEDIISVITDFEANVKELISLETPISISFPGPISQSFQILSAPTVVGESDSFPDLCFEIKNRTGRQTFILNDISAAAWYLSEGVQAQRFMVVTISSGIGSKIFDRKHPQKVLDNMPYAGEIGHIIVDFSPNAIRCDCGGSGHLGAIASGRGIERLAAIRAEENQKKFELSACFREFGADKFNLTNEKHLVPAAKLSDSWSLEIIREGTRPLAQTLLSAILACGLDKVLVIGGFALSLNDIYLETLRTAILEACDYPVLYSYLKDIIVMGDAQEEVCLLGAASYIRHLKQKY